MFSSENFFDSKWRSRSIPSQHLHWNDSSSEREKLPHSSFQSQNTETYPKKIPSSSSNSEAYQVPAPVGLKNLHITIGSFDSDWFQIFRNWLMISCVNSFIELRDDWNTLLNKRKINYSRSGWYSSILFRKPISYYITIFDSQTSFKKYMDLPLKSYK